MGVDVVDIRELALRVLPSEEEETIPLFEDQPVEDTSIRFVLEAEEDEEENSSNILMLSTMVTLYPNQQHLLFHHQCMSIRSVDRSIGRLFLAVWLGSHILDPSAARPAQKTRTNAHSP